jgi:tetratricopeptide (TPR) repeat protein
MKPQSYFLAILILISHTSLAQNTSEKFRLNRIGIKIQKPKNYLLLTPETVKQLKEKYFSYIDICSELKSALDITIKNPNCQTLMNEENNNETMTFTRYPKFEVNKNDTKFFLEKMKTECYSIKNTKIENLSISNGINQIGSYVSLLNKITTPVISFYSEVYFFETRNSTVIVSINSLNKISNSEFVNSFEYINNIQYEELINEANSLIGTNDFTQAKSKLLDATYMETENVLAFEKLAKLNLILKNYNDVIEVANKILNIDISNINGYLMKGCALIKQKKYTEALKCFKIAEFNYSLLITTNTQNEYYTSFSETYRLIAEAYIDLKDASNAIENFESALMLEYDSLNTASIYYNLGIVHSTLLNDTKEAIKFYSLAISNYPKYAFKEKSESFYNRGINKRYIDDFKGAIADYTSAIKLSPNYAKAYNNRGVANILIEDYAAAIYDFTMTIKYDNFNTEITIIALGNRGYAKYLTGKDGCIDLKESIEKGSKNAIQIQIFNQFCKN